MVQGLSLTPVDLLNGGPQLGHSPRGKGIQHPGNRRLVGKPLPPPRRGECRLRPQARVDLLEGGAVGQHADDDVEQFLMGRVKDRLAVELDVLADGCKEILLLQKGAKCGQGSILRVTIHRR
jgi:hypothetical protein